MHHARAVPKLGIEAHRESMNSLLWVTTPRRRAIHYHSALLQEEQVRRLPPGGLSDLACRRGEWRHAPTPLNANGAETD